MGPPLPLTWLEEAHFEAAPRLASKIQGGTCWKPSLIDNDPRFTDQIDEESLAGLHISRGKGSSENHRLKRVLGVQ